jgi:cyclophilin family peptidyl-prolyl cis-trans isomerase
MRLAIGLAIILSGCLSSAPTDSTLSPAPGGGPDLALMAQLEQLSRFPEMRIETDFGTIRTMLYADWTPETAAHIGNLAAAGFYDGLTIHRVVDDFVIQGGDPTGTGEGGSGPGGVSTNRVPLEIKDGLQFGSGAIGLARWTDDTGDSQWFITEKPALHLNNPSGATGDLFGAYSLFGQVFSGMQAVRQMAAVATLPNDKPVDDVIMHSVSMHEPPAINLIGLVPVVRTVSTPIGEVMVEHPMFLVEGVPATFRFQLTSGCVAELNVSSVAHSGDARQDRIVDAMSDACTNEGNFTFEAPGSWSVMVDGQGFDGAHVIEVLPWHEAYGP